MNQSEITNALEKGFGRIYLYIEKNGDESIREQLLHFCLKNPSYDTQCEDSRAEWLISLINLSKNRSFYIPKIIAALSTSYEFSDVSQLYKLCQLIAQQSDESAKQAIYEKFDAQEFNESYMGGEEIIQLDGLKGLLHVANVIGKRLLEEDDYWESDMLYCITCEMIGKEITDEFLAQHAKENRYVTAYLEELKRHEERSKPKDSQSHRERFRDEYPLERILDDIINNTKRNRLGIYNRFGRYATEDEIERVFNLLLAETNNEKLIRYFWVFRNRELPRLPELITNLAFSNDHEIQGAAISALSNLSDSRIREIAIKLSLNSDSQIALNAIELFINNYQIGDSKYIEPLLNHIKDNDVCHWVCMDVIKLFEKHQPKECINMMLWAYENTPCTHCRNWAVRLLIEKNWLPETYLNECLYDCVEETRELAKKHRKTR
jgi:hypothetical protein